MGFFGKLLVSTSLRRGTTPVVRLPASPRLSWRLLLLASCWMCLSLGQARAADQEERERLVNKQDADLIFALTRDEWNVKAQQMFHPDGWKVRIRISDTGNAFMAVDPRTSTALGVQPVYDDAKSPPTVLIVSSFFAVGTLGNITDDLRRRMEDGARLDLGPQYAVSVTVNRSTKPPPGLDEVHVMISRPRP
jgi:hypothetical protein